jgi:hypothetical protein
MVSALKALFSLLFLVIVSSSCSHTKNPEFARIENLRISRMGLSKSTVSADLVYMNPNKFGIRLLEAAGDAWLENEYLGRFVVDGMVHIAPRSEFRIPVSLVAGTGKLITSSLSAYFSRDMEVKFKGEAKLAKGIFVLNYPFSYEGKHKLDSLLR